jgi:DNA-binding transcriptional LysR family regulator
MEQRDIEIFLTLADELHFARAAQRLHVSTARVSQTIKKLERRIGGPLFERISRRVQLTPIGHRLGDELRPAYQQIHDAIDAVMTAGPRRPQHTAGRVHWRRIQPVRPRGGRGLPG